MSNDKNKMELEKIVEVGDKIRLGDDCRASGELAIVDEVKKWVVVAYINHPTDENKRAYFRIPHGSYELVSSGKTMQ